MTPRDARLDLLLNAVCALAAALPKDAKLVAGASLAGRLTSVCPHNEPTDTAVAADLARILETLGCLPSVALPHDV